MRPAGTRHILWSGPSGGTNVVGKKVFIVGGGNSAGQAAMFLSSYAAEVKVLVRGEGLKLSMSQYLIDQIASKANIQVLSFTQVVSAGGEDHLKRIEARVQAPHEIWPCYDTNSLDTLYSRAFLV
jgi:thioredoxin reductase